MGLFVAPAMVGSYLCAKAPDKSSVSFATFLFCQGYTSIQVSIVRLQVQETENSASEPVNKMNLDLGKFDPSLLLHCCFRCIS